MGYGCHPSRCKCRPAKCSIQMEEAALHIEDIGGERNSSDSDSETEDFCYCTTVNSECGDTLCYCLAIKQLPCVLGRCKCDPTTIAYHISTDSHDTHVHDFCSNHSKKELVSLLERVALKYLHVWAVISFCTSTDTKSTLVQVWKMQV